ncbi:YmfQ family protein [Gluconobacter cerinus]|uniref:YmfQ family protein n=1 Tax=Gluconobacter cerinus TaxID=38307 RepID=UPI000C073BFC|nr:putative phage tail protein [Gluconobacter cerinus]
MSLPSFLADDFRQAILRLLPRGAIWSRDQGDLPSLLAGIWGQTFARNSQRATNLLTDAFPASTVELLQEWENSTGLPDPCAGTSPTLEQRRDQVLARLTDSGGSSVEYFTAFAEILGFKITILEHTPACVGKLRVGDPLNGRDWAYAWTVSFPGYSPVYFRVGESAVDQPLQAWGNAVLQCEIRSRLPAHTIVLFAQNGENLLSDFGLDII